MRTMLLSVLGALLLAGCGDDEPDKGDEDGDGYAAEVDGGEDCDDADASVYPGAEEVCDGVDQDCDGEVDEGAVDALVFYGDADVDGYGSDAAPEYGCEAPFGTVEVGGDCDDGDDDVYPGAEEVCDGVDNDCDGDSDGGATDASTWYRDADGDGHGDPEVSREECEAPSGYVAEGDDCDDFDDERSPDLEEICSDYVDNDCDGAVDGGCPEICDDGADNDGDGLADCEDGDCTDEAHCTEECDNGEDDDADGLVDCEDDECWGTAECHGPIRAKATGGVLYLRDNLEWSSSSYGSGSYAESQRMVSATAYGVRGLVQVLSRTSLTWSTATDWESCRWSLSTALFSYQYHWMSHSGSSTATTWATGPVRAGFYVAPGCGLSTSGFLPRVLRPGSPWTSEARLYAGSAAVTLWYHGRTSSMTSSSYSTGFSSGGSYLYSGWVTHSWYLNTLSGGSWYTTP